MSCKYVKEDGSPCKSYGALGSEWGKAAGYCLGHARKLKLLPPEVEQKRKDRVSKSQTEVHKERNKQERKILSKDLPVDSPECKEAIGDMYSNIVGDKEFNLVQLKEDLIEMGSGDLFRETEAVKLGLFAEWCVADTGTRIPKTFAEVAEVLEVKQMTLRQWLDSDSFQNNMSKIRMRTAAMVGPHIDKINNILALGGNKNAIAKYYDQFGKPEVKDEDEDEFDRATKEMEEKARRLSGKQDGGGVNLTDDERDAMENLVELEPIEDESNE